MKKSILLALFAAFCLVDANSQSIVNYEEATKNRTRLFITHGDRYVHCGKESCEDEYIIIPFEGQSQAQLFNKMMSVLNDEYVDVDKVVTKKEPEEIIVNAQLIYELPIPFLYNKEIYYSSFVNHRFTFKFKDGELRIDAPVNISVDYFSSGEEHLRKIVPFETFSFELGDLVGSEVIEKLFKILKKLPTSDEE